MRWKPAAIVSAVLILGSIAAWGLRGREQCPAKLETDGPRAARIVRILDATRQGRVLLSHSPDSLAICFDKEGPGVLRTDRIAVLSSTASDPENAARLGHLLFHLADSVSWPGTGMPSEDCGKFVARAVKAEERAYQLENDLRQELRISAGLSFDPVYWRRVFEARCGSPKPAEL